MVQPMPDNPFPSESCPTPSAESTVGVADASDRGLVIPEIEETAEITTRMIETGVVRISKHVHDVERTFHPQLHDQRIHVERIPVNRVIKSAPEIRTQGDTTIIPIVEEVMVKLLLLKEEVHVTRTRVNKPSEPQHVTLRREEVIIDRRPAGQAQASPGPACVPPSAAAPATPKQP